MNYRKGNPGDSFRRSKVVDDSHFSPARVDSKRIVSLLPLLELRDSCKRSREEFRWEISEGCAEALFSVCATMSGITPHHHVRPFSRYLIITYEQRLLCLRLGKVHVHFRGGETSLFQQHGSLLSNRQSHCITRVMEHSTLSMSMALTKWFCSDV